jgi:hypothetical protein
MRKSRFIVFLKLGVNIMLVVAKRPPTSVFFDFLPSGIPAFEPYKILRWEQHGY